MINNKYLNQRGISIFIAVGFMGAIILLALGVSSVIAFYLSGSGNVEIMNQAYFAAEGRIEDGLYDITEHLSGYENLTNKDRSEFSEDNTTDAAWIVESRLPLNPYNDLYTIPPADEGTSEDKQWNRLSIGETVSLDLFLDDSLALTATTSDKITNISDFFLASFKLLIRTPPDETGISPDLQIVELEDIQVSLQDDTILNWTLSGVDKNNEEIVYTLRESPSYKREKAVGGAWDIQRLNDQSSEIYESKINSRMDTDFVVLNSNNSDHLSGISVVNSGISNETPGVERSINWFLKDSDGLDIHKSNFTFSLISKLFNNTTSEIIPYLEYQVLLDSDKPVSNEFFTITAHGYAGNFKQTIVTKVKTGGAISLLEYAIFQ